MGENFQAIGHLPTSARLSLDAERHTFDVLVAAEHQIMILAPRLKESDDAAPAAAKPEIIAENDQMMLRRGELDVEGMGRLLNGMQSGSASLRMGSPVKRTRIFT